ncbi:MAG: hypothetical protein NT011_13645 [Kiritimatiellaeota bacterium]|nr:hypothetical protein [Kiritimatiellota bacterium]
MKRIIRVFPRRTRATPDDNLVAVARPPDLFDEADEVHISITFSWDFEYGMKLADQWKTVAPVKIGGPATGCASGEFVPGMYLRKGYTITSRGCPNHCWFCDVWQREGQKIRELPIRCGWNVLDDNLLACSEKHIRDVFAMLRRQSETAQFTGGLEAKRLRWWHVELLARLHPKQMFFAYDTEDDLEPLREAGRMMLNAGFTKASHVLRCYVLCGWQKDNTRKADTTEVAEQRMKKVMDVGFTPMAMLYIDRNFDRRHDHAWIDFQRRWARPAIIHSK